MRVLATAAQLWVLRTLCAAAGISSGHDGAMVTHSVHDLGPSGCPSSTLRPCSGHGSCIPDDKARHPTRYCRCDRGFSGAACEVPEYLQSCPLNCSGATGGGQCVGDRCVCEAGRSGDACDGYAMVNCTAGCGGHGECIRGRCLCSVGFYGLSCEQGCSGYLEAQGAVCSGHGLCVPSGSPGHSPDVCKCFIGFAGEACDQDLEGVTSCPHNCSAHGTCRHGRCTCVGRFAGSDCSIELRRGQLAYLLDSWRARLGAALLCFLASAILAAAALRYINATDSKVLAARDRGLPLHVFELSQGEGTAGVRVG